ncbi:MAG: hypothetical protein PHF86_02630 [Candidatus Nanoarchaeia archaeon]|jgi:hypothetical protein|nr:hypothetical protein [Candidatus Nanoarchaeia archaeon]
MLEMMKIMFDKLKVNSSFKWLEFHNRPTRSQPINDDNIVNLRIALNTAKLLEEFFLLV